MLRSTAPELPLRRSALACAVLLALTPAAHAQDAGASPDAPALAVAAVDQVTVVDSRARNRTVFDSAVPIDGPNNGLFTLIAERDGVAELREIDEKVNRLEGSAESYTFHGRDVYAFVGARLASEAISFAQVGPVLPSDSVVKIPYQKAERKGDTIRGIIPVLDVKYGNVWTNIPKSLFEELKIGAHDQVRIRFLHKGQE